MGGGIVRNWWQQPHEVEAAGVEVGAAPRLHHQESLGVVVEGGDAGRHADSEGEPGDAGETDGGGEEGVEPHMWVINTQQQTRYVCLSQGFCLCVHVTGMWCVRL